MYMYSMALCLHTLWTMSVHTATFKCACTCMPTTLYYSTIHVHVHVHHYMYMYMYITTCIHWCVLSVIYITGMCQLLTRVG